VNASLLVFASSRVDSTITGVLSMSGRERYSAEGPAAPRSLRAGTHTGAGARLPERRCSRIGWQRGRDRPGLPRASVPGAPACRYRRQPGSGGSASSCRANRTAVAWRTRARGASRYGASSPRGWMRASSTRETLSTRASSATTAPNPSTTRRPLAGHLRLHLTMYCHIGDRPSP